MASMMAFGLVFASCSSDENPTIVSNTTTLTATLDGKSEKPASTTSAATGTFLGSLNNETRVLSYTVTYQGFTEPVTGGHLHKITKADGTGPVDVPFKSLTNPIIETTAALPQSKVDSMLAGLYYANLHTKTYPGGEIRGEVKKK